MIRASTCERRHESEQQIYTYTYTYIRDAQFQGSATYLRFTRSNSGQEAAGLRLIRSSRALCASVEMSSKKTRRKCQLATPAPSMLVDEGLCLNSKPHVLTTDCAAALQECSDAVIGVEKQFYANRAWEIHQKAAKLIAELNGKGKSGKAALDFLKDTLDTYDRFRRLERASELRKKQDLTDAEQAILQELTNDDNLAPFLTK